MNWEAIGTVAEVVGAIAVVLSLIYVATQIKQNTAASRAQMINQINSQYGALMSQIATNGDLAKIYQKATEGSDLEPDETVRYTAYLSAFFAFVEEIYLLHRSGTYEEDLGDGDAVEFLAPTVRRLLNSPAAARWWKGESRNLYVPELCDRVDHIANLTYDFPPGA
jgi:hypothetical protein